MFYQIFFSRQVKRSVVVSNKHVYTCCLEICRVLSPPPEMKTLSLLEPFSKKCDIWCHKEYTDKNEKQVGYYVT